MRELNQKEFSEIMKQFNFWWLNTSTTTNDITTTPLTEKILLECYDIIKEESMRKLLREILEMIEKNNIKEILFFRNEFLNLQWKAIITF